MYHFFDEPSEIIQAQRLIGLGQTDEALQLLGTAINKHITDVSNSYKNLLIAEQAILYLTEFDNEKKALALIDQVTENIEKKDIYYIKILIAKAEIFLNTNFQNSGIEIANTIIELSNSLNYSEEKAIGEYLIAFGNYQKGNIHIALEFSNSAVEKLKNSENYFYQVKSLIVYGYCLKNLGDLSKGLQILELAETIAKSQNFNHNLLPSILQMIGELKLNLGEYKAAERYIKNCYSLTIFSQNVRNKNIFYKCISDLAELIYLQGDIQRSVSQLKNSYHE